MIAQAKQLDFAMIELFSAHSLSRCSDKASRFGNFIRWQKRLFMMYETDMVASNDRVRGNFVFCFCTHSPSLGLFQS